MPTETTETDGKTESAKVCSGTADSLAAIPKFIWTKMYVFVLLIALFIFTLIGGAIFYAFEQSHEYKNYQNGLKEQGKEIRAVILKLQETACENNIKCKEVIEIEIENFIDGWNKTIEEKTKYNWQEYWNATWYATTIYTTIGYGNLAPATDAGKIFTIIYALIGIPLMLSFLNELGKKICYALDAMCTKLQHLRGKNIKKTCRFPVAMALIIIIVYVFLCATIVLMTHKTGPLDNYLDAIYFIFISLTTIGLGDVMPEDPNQISRSFVFLFVGLALVSTFISMFNARIEDRYFAAIEAVKERMKNDGGKNTAGTVAHLTRCHFAFDEKSQCQSDDGKVETCNEFPPAVLGLNQVRPEYRKHTPRAASIDIETVNGKS